MTLRDDNERADATERTSLLNKPVSHGRPPYDSDSEDGSVHAPKGHATTRVSLTAILLYLVLCLVIAALLCFAAVHFAVGRTMHQIDLHGGYQVFGEKALLYELQGVRLDSVQDDGVAFSVQGRAGVDVARGLDWEDRSVFGRWQRYVTRYGVKVAKGVDVRMGHDGMLLSSKDGHSLLRIIPQRSLTVPVKYGQSGKDWLRSFDLPMKMDIVSSEALAKMAKQAWEKQVAHLDATLSHVKVQPRAGLFKTLTSITLTDITRNVQVDVPRLSFLDDPSKLVNLSAYTITPRTDDRNISRLLIAANATLDNPLVAHRHEFPSDIRKYFPLMGNDTTRMPWTIPFQSYLLHEKKEVAFGRVSLQPFSFAPFQPLVPLTLAGAVLPAQNDSAALEQAFSRMLSNYLAGKPTPMHVRLQPSPDLPGFVNSLAGEMDAVALELPGSPDPDMELLKNVRIEEMSLDGTGPNSELLCSGRVIGELFLPPGLEGLSAAINVTQLWPDILIFDGSAPLLDKKPFPPTPLPPKAFARVDPSSWSSARTRIVKVADPDHPKRTIEAAQVEMLLKAVPFTVLPGRGDVFRSYIAKIILQSGSGPGGKVQTGIGGLARIRTEVKGLGSLALDDVQVKGTFFVGRSFPGH